MKEPNIMELEEMRSYTIDALRRINSGSARSGIDSLQRETLRKEANIDRNEQQKFNEVIFNLMNEGILMWGGEDIQWGPPFLAITSYGKKVLEEQTVVPHDYDGYLNNFRKEVPDASPLVLKYLTESIETFRHGNLLASSVMLGVASEAAFEVLFDSLKNYISGPKKEKFERLEKEVSTKRKFEETLKEIESVKSRLPPKLKDNILFHIEGIFHLIRYQRNDSGHPTEKDVNRAQMLSNLLVFVMYCRNVYDLVDFLKHGQL